MIKLTITESKSDKYYYAQMSVRNGKKVRSETIKKIGKHSELLKITEDPETYAKAIVRQLDDEYRNAKAPLVFNVDFSNIKKSSRRQSVKKPPRRAPRTFLFGSNHW